MRRQAGADDPQKAVEELAVKALEFLAQEEDRLHRFLAETGFDPAALRRVAGQPGFAAAVLGYVMGDDRLVTGLADHAGLRPERIAALWARLDAAGEGAG